MSKQDARTCSPGPDPRTIRTENGKVVKLPADWELVPPGDATLTRRIKQAGPSWTVQERKGRRTFSQGVWAPSKTVAEIRTKIEAERATPAYAAAKRSRERRRDRVQEHYGKEFRDAVLYFLDFAPRYDDLAVELAQRVADHATPIGSGTVARTQRIPLPQRAEAAVIAWLRHQTTAYDHTSVARVKGARRELRRELAQRSRRLLNAYRRGDDTPQNCPLQQTLAAPPKPDRNTTPKPTRPKPAQRPSYDDFFADD
jgi:hypothetical protein